MGMWFRFDRVFSRPADVKGRERGERLFMANLMKERDLDPQQIVATPPHLLSPAKCIRTEA